MSPPNTRSGGEERNRALTGSSKRKRKHSVKRNIVVDDNSSCDDSCKTTKIEKTYGTRSKGEKGKSKKIAVEVEEAKTEDEAVNDDPPNCEQVKSEATEENEPSKVDESEETCKNLESADSDSGQCTSENQQCQNCKFCSKHIIKKEDSDEPKEKQKKRKKGLPCEICAKEGVSKMCTSTKQYKHHLATDHEMCKEETKRFECIDCPNKVWFPTKSKFTYHLGTKHPGIMRFICEVCTETFILKANYRSHLKSHNLVVEKKFSCDVCSGTFVNRAGYEAHKTRFPGPHIKQSCSHCGFSFSNEKHLKNHRCKTLLLKEAAVRPNKTQSTQHPSKTEETVEPKDILKTANDSERKTTDKDTQANTEPSKKTTETSQADSSQKKPANDKDTQPSKRRVSHRAAPRRNQDQTMYRPVQMQAQTLPESLVVQELREIDLEGGAFIATAAPAATITTEPEQQFIVRDINGHLLQGNQILQLDINDIQQGEENQVYLADWNIVAPYVIREKSP